METKKNAGKTPDNAQKPSDKQPENVQKRVFKGEKEVHHDLYKLQVAEVVKNSSWWSSKPTFIGHEHHNRVLLVITLPYHQDSPPLVFE